MGSMSDSNATVSGAIDNARVTVYNSSDVEISVATTSLQTAGNNSLASIDAGIPAGLGQTTMAASMPVVLASDQTAIPVSVSTNAADKATFVVYAQDIAIGNGKSMVSIVNTTGSTVKIKIRSIKLINSQNTAVTGVNAEFDFRKIVGHSAGISLTPLSFDSTDTLSGSVTARTGATVTSEGALYKHAVWSSDEWGVGTLDTEASDHGLQELLPVYLTPINCKPITLNDNEGFHIKQTVNSTAGTFDFELIFTQES
jgi:hypothetical protein